MLRLSALACSPDLRDQGIDPIRIKFVDQERSLRSFSVLVRGGDLLNGGENGARS